MSDLRWDEFRRRCLKPDPERLGSWTARRLARPAALRITWLAASSRLTADHATAAAAVAALAAVVAFGYGTAIAWLLGSTLLTLWYLLDHVDGQLARLRRTASLDGTALDYVMHHSWNMLLPIGVGFGLARATGDAPWYAAGVCWGWGSLLIGLRHDARYKSFVQRLKLVHGELHTCGGGGGRPEPAPAPSRGTIVRWCVLKMYEPHVVIAALWAASLARLAFGPIGDRLAQAYAAATALPAPLLGLALVVRSARRGEAEREFAAWFRVPEGRSLELRDGWWYVRPVEPEPPPAVADASCSADERDVLTCRQTGS